MKEVVEFQVVGDTRISLEMNVAVDVDEPLLMQIAAKRALRKEFSKAVPAIREALKEQGVIVHTVSINIELVTEI